MKKIFKLLSYILLFTLAFTCLIACGDSSDDPGKDPVIKDVQVTSITVNGKRELEIDATSNYTVTVLPENATKKAVVWSSSDPNVLTIDTNGKAQALKNGTATITATSTDGSEVEGTAIITVKEKDDDTDTPPEMVDYASEIKLDMNTNTLKQVVTVKTYVDGDTTHFNVSPELLPGGVVKARYLGINTPESTGKIEEYGKKASKFTKEKLLSAESIIIESDDDKLNADSTGGRYLLWIWYKTANEESYRNLNVELLQNGLAIASNSANNRYGTTCVSAINQAKDLKLNVYSGEKDPDMYYGDAKEISLSELRININNYNGVKVAFEGNVIKDYNNGVYVEEYDAENNIYNGIFVYYGFGAMADVTKILTVGNRVRVVGICQYYETGGTYQISGLQYRAMRPNDPSNVQKIGDGVEAAYPEVTADDFINSKLDIEVDDEIKEMGYAQLAMNSSIAMNNLQVKSIYTTDNEESSSNGAMTLTCEVGDVTVKIRTIVLYDENKNIITESAYLNKNISVKGIVDYFDGTYQIKIFSPSDIIVNE